MSDLRASSADVIAAAFVDGGVRDIFSVVGGGNLLPMIAAAERGIDLRAARHESGAVAMAAAYAHASGRVGVATTTRGPGFTNTLTALVTVARDRLPFVLYTADSLPEERWGNQYLDQRVMSEAAGARFIDCTDPARLRQTVLDALAIALQDRCAVVLSIPGAVAEAPATDQVAETASRPVPASPNPVPPPDPSVLASIAAAIDASSRPLILAGRGAVVADARDLLERLGERIGALFANTLPVSGFFHGNDYEVGVAGGFSLAGRRRLLEDADLVLAFGAGLTSYTTSDGKLFAGATIVQVDHDPDAIGRKHRADIGLVADVADAAAALLTILGDGPAADSGFRTPQTLAALQATHRGQDLPDASGPEGLDPRAFLRALDDALPADRRVVVDLGHHATFSTQTMTFTYPGQLYNAFGFSALGLGLPAALGLAVARPDETVVAFVGDGGLCMSLAELETLARFEPNLVLVVMNDHGYGAEVHKAGRHGLDPTIAQFPVTPFAALAESLGIRSATVRAPEDVALVPELVATRTGPLVIDVRMHPFVVGAARYGRPTEGAVATAAGRS